MAFGRPINYEGAGGSPNYVLNDRTSQPLLWQQSPFYYIHVEDVEGLRAAEMSTESHPIPNNIGERSGDIFRRGKAITISGRIEAMSLGYLEQGADWLQLAFTDTSKRRLIWPRWADGVSIYLTCRVVNDLSVVETVVSDKYQWEFVVGLRADDPRTRNASGGGIYPSWQ
jgi:hypothetical protein